MTEDVHELRRRIDQLQRGMAPLPMTEGQAIIQAVRLRNNSGLSYSQIGAVMRIYHGQNRSEAWWRSALRARGVAPVYRGSPLPNMKAAA